MKKLLLIPALMTTLAFSAEYNYEVTPVIGYNIAEGNLNLDNEIIGGLQVQFNDVESAVKPELSILHSGGVNSESPAPAASTNITRLGLSGVYEYANTNSVIPFAKAGLGYETMSRYTQDNTDGVFVNAGAGVKVPFTDTLALKLEALYMLKHNDKQGSHNWGDSNLALLAGLNYSFGSTAQKPVPFDGDSDGDGVKNSIDKCPETPAGKVVNAEGCFIDGDDDNDGVLNANDKCPNTPLGKTVNAEGCFVDNDNDKDGVLNANDKCPNSPANAAVNADGCPIIVNLHVNFELNSYEVRANSNNKINDFAAFLNMYPNYDAKIVGHTDNTGKTSYNQSLSQNRAKAVTEMLVKQGVKANRITASGMGETAPVATNKTKEGRAENRRIEAELIKN